MADIGANSRGVINRVAHAVRRRVIGYAIIDSWDIPPLSRAHPTFGRSTSRGFYTRLK
ncbi:hypothetical protein [Vitreimonas flagellata]|uniref:hypothetical protein n=1 Tax=Vitreimonas flagellata TaxID=2560861 RepID=UPI001EF7CFA6|nr:hypothetical protein [Vitreimonas flagellata]